MRPAFKTALTIVTLSAIGSVTPPATAAVPFTWDGPNSNFTASGTNVGVGGGLYGQSFFTFMTILGGAGFTGGGTAGVMIFNADGVRFNFSQLNTLYFNYGSEAKAEFTTTFLFTPTVPNLSYSFEGFMNITLTGSPASTTANGDVVLHPDNAHPIPLYVNNVATSGPCAIWVPGASALGNTTGNLTQGQPYRMNAVFRIDMRHGNDPAAAYELKLKNNPYFRFRLYQRPCPGDLSGDGYVDDTDFVAFAFAYSLLDCADPAMPVGCPSDLNGDGFVDDSDFVVFATMYENLVCP